MATRTVTGLLKKPNGSAWAGGRVVIVAYRNTYRVLPSETYPLDPLTVVADANGIFTATLIAGPDRLYDVFQPNGDKFRFLLLDAVPNPVDIEVLRADYDGVQPDAAPITSEIIEALLANTYGVTGPRGVTGPLGLTGPLGPTGVTGPQGVTGPNPLPLYPATLGNAVTLWLKADDLALNDGDPVSAWTDASSYGRTPTATGTTRPILKKNILNNKPVVRFDGIDDVMIGPGLSLPQPYTVLAVAKITTANTRIWTGGTSTPTISRGSTTGAMFMNAGLSFQIGTATGLYDLYRAEFNGANSKGSFNGVETLGNAHTFGSGATFAIGGTTIPSAFLNGDIAELIILNRNLTTDEALAMEAYLGQKYALDQELPRPHLWFKPAAPRVYDIKKMGGAVDGVTDDILIWERALGLSIAAGSGVIYLPAGTSYISRQISMNGVRNITFMGDGMELSTILGSGGVSEYIITTENSQGLYVHDLSLDNQGTGNTPLRFHSSDPFDFTLMKEIRVERVHSKNHNSQGILFQVSATDVEVIACITDGGLRAIRFSGYINHSRIIGNNCKNSAESGINIGGSTYVTVEGNTVARDVATDDGYAGIRLTNGGSHIAVTGNTVARYGRGVGYYALPEGGEVVSVEGADVAIVGNTIYQTYNTGILIERSNCTVVGNTIRNCNDEAGVYLSGLSGAPVTGCTVVGNSIIDDRTPPHHTYGVLEGSESNYNVIANNAISGYLFAPVGLVGPYSRGETSGLIADGTTPAGNTIANTTVEGNFATAHYTFEANTLRVGMEIHIRASGIYSTAPSGLNLGMRLYDGTNYWANTGTLATILNMVNRGWDFECTAIVAAVGTAGKIEVQGMSRRSTSTIAAQVIDLESTAQITLNTTVAKTINLSAYWITADPLNTITLRQWSVEIRNDGRG